MPRPPNPSTHEWSKEPDGSNDSWVLKGKCRERQDLPWTDDLTPGALDLDDMARICASCPVLVRCARHAVGPNKGGGEKGGFYAGVWIPWAKDSVGGPASRRDAREQLRRIAQGR